MLLLQSGLQMAPNGWGASPIPSLGRIPFKFSALPPRKCPLLSQAVFLAVLSLPSFLSHPFHIHTPGTRAQWTLASGAHKVGDRPPVLCVLSWCPLSQTPLRLALSSAHTPFSLVLACPPIAIFGGAGAVSGCGSAYSPLAASFSPWRSLLSPALPLPTGEGPSLQLALAALVALVGSPCFCCPSLLLLQCHLSYLGGGHRIPCDVASSSLPPPVSPSVSGLCPLSASPGYSPPTTSPPFSPSPPPVLCPPLLLSMVSLLCHCPFCHSDSFCSYSCGFSGSIPFNTLDTSKVD